MLGSVLVTGGAGFIGQRLVSLLLKAGYSVVVVDDCSAGQALQPETAGLRCVRLDIRDTKGLAALVAEIRPSVIVHLAALHHIPTCTNDPARTLSINVLGTQSLLDSCKDLSSVRIVLASSGAVYAWGQEQLSEIAPLAPADIYSISKQTNEAQVALWVTQGVDTAIRRSGRVARLFNVIGEHDPNGHLIPDLMSRLLPHLDQRDGPIQLRLGALSPRRDYISVEDAARGLFALVADTDESSFEAYNLCSGTEVSVAELAEHLAHLLGVRVSLVSDPELVRRIDRPSQWGAPTKARDRLGFVAQDTLDDVLGRMCRREIGGKPLPIFTP